jgi:energy-coupling factor transport system ATP-binding protein
MEEQQMEVFNIQDLTYFYPNSKIPAIKDINVKVNEGDFILLIGESGSGKSTLARVFNKIVPQFYGGKIKGNITENINVGMVFQDPENQMIMDSVEREVAFPLENMGIERDRMYKKVIETFSYMNLWDLKDKKTYELSGGQQQKVAISSILAMGHKFLVLDEPTSQLDPALADEILNIVKRLNEELGYTIILIEQRVDRCFNFAERIWYMERGELLFDGSKEEFLYKENINFLPSITRLFYLINSDERPLTVKEGRKQLKKYKFKESNKEIKARNMGSKIIDLDGVYFDYEKNFCALRDINLSFLKGNTYGIMGETGCGKTTLLKQIAGLLSPTQGSVKVKASIGYLSQNPNDYLFNETVYNELKFTLDNYNIKEYFRIDDILKALDIYKYKDMNPRDLSSGERQRVALASILVTDPDILLLDEPTRGLDNSLKEKIGVILQKLKEREKTIIVVTHDIEFAGEYLENISLMFKGSIVQTGNKYEVLGKGIYYSTQMNKLFDGFVDNIVTLNDAKNIITNRLENII